MSPVGSSEHQRDQRTDQELIGAINRGDPAAFDALYRRHRDWAWRIARRFTRDDASASDVVQAAFLQLLARFPGFKLTSKFTTYLYPVVRNLAATEARRARRLTIQPVEAEPIEAVASDSSFGAEGNAALRNALARLPETHREVLLMRAVDQMTIPEIALALALPEGTVKSRLHNALQTLRQVPELASYFADA